MKPCRDRSQLLARHGPEPAGLRGHPHGPARRPASERAGLALLSLIALAGSAEASGWDAFPAFVWRLDHDGMAPPKALLAPFGGTNVEGDEEAAWAFEQGLDVYVGRAAGWSELHLRREFSWYDALWTRWYEERDATLCVREPCLTDPATRARLFEHVEQTFAARDGRHGLFALLGDEVGLTPWGDPFDLCTSPTCRAAWRAYLEQHPLDPGLKSGAHRLPETDAVRLAFVDGNTAQLGAWLARRRFHQDVVLELLRDLATEARRRAPETELGLAGLVGRTAFGGVAFEELLDVLDVLEPYPVSDARELAFTLRTSERILTTVFAHGLEHATDDRVRASIAAGSAWQVWEHWLRGGDGVVLWSDRELARSTILHERLARAVADVRALRATLPHWRPTPSGIAVLHDGDSVALAWLRDALLDGPTWPRRFQGHQEEHGTRERELRAWLRLAEDVGLLPGALPLERVQPETAARFPVLIANHLSVLDETDRARLARFVEAGGTLLVSGPFADFDRAGRPVDENALALLREKHPDRVRRAPTDVTGYLETRIGDERPRAIELRGWLAERIQAAGLASVPFRVDCADATLPWLVARSGTGDTATWALLPNAQDNATRQDSLVALRLAIGGGTVTWLHPAEPDEAGEAGTVRLDSGEAAVFRFVPDE